MKPYRTLAADIVGVSREDILTASDAEQFDKIGIDPVGEGVTFTWKQ